MRARYIFLCLSLATGSLTAGADAGDYVWARTPWGSSNVNGHYSSMSNGYGGYYVPRSGYGNNYESHGNFTNPNGYIVPSAPQSVQNPGPHFGGHRWRTRRF